MAAIHSGLQAAVFCWVPDLRAPELETDCSTVLAVAVVADSVTTVRHRGLLPWL